ncbi:hypothetical protein C7399_112100 [Paraburkholderia tropica]|uniref:Winged helix-turn-helix domain-containing protein n=1 Tax=Paraburkholderia tropica TaxID=92647 RepID=A0ABX5MLG2_9BURK|nr:hypothetical protein [Paraburkholderia tropica]PXX14491.1 hypothetical protein C7400_112101 [Paraburkholderia tropica]PZW79556.1 hypothetical protein C7399_112100 [Paraburkholderia tropica]
MRSTATQLAAHGALDANGERLTQKKMVMNLFEGPSTVLTREDIAARTNLKLSSVCGRVFDLVASEMLTVRGTRKCAATGLDHELVGLPSPF